jgi:hypothetical protein
MDKFLKELVDIGSTSLSSAVPSRDEDFFGVAGGVLKDLLELFKWKNGFYAFESALHVFPSQSIGIEIGLVEWNAADLWINEYQGMADGSVFFAEDIFGGQFCIRHDGIYSFDPETAGLELLARDLEGWAKLVLDDYEFLTGYPLAHEWQQSRGKLISGNRLVPKIPFVVGGDFSVANLYELNAVKAMQLRGSLANQIKNIPDGATIRWKLED